ncbi:hypothetical protein AXF42_Ash021458 [Apostasia shenzhenica]|uniref:Uncharacterized protein n=1 Tax=Apostasia shenzhenica TaxID=1088818 RepID=A0A2H9ZSU1_9ASPA|nr:hypothetical protein AXF42_Ash021458 [Apostasia shenzhenica]
MRVPRAGGVRLDVAAATGVQGDSELISDRPGATLPNVVAYVYYFLKLLQAQGIPWTLTLFRSLFSWMAVPGYGRCLALQSKTRKAMFSGASSSHSNWRDYYFFVVGDLGIPLTPGTCLPEFEGDAK